MKKITAMAVALTMLLSLSACSSNEGGSRAEAGVTTIKAKNAEDEVETKAAEKNADLGELVEPPEYDFNYGLYSDKSVVIEKYKGDATAIRIPAEINGNPVVYVKLSCSNSLKTVEIPEGVTSIEFERSSKLESVNIPNSVTKIGEGAFKDCESLKSIEIPNSVTEIGESAFEDCKSLESIEIPSSVVEIGQDAFWECQSLESIEIPGSVESMICTFRSCTNLKSVILHEGLKTIGGNMFWKCESLESISIPDSVECIGNGAFEGCTSLKSLTLPDNVTLTKGYSTEENAFFRDCPELTVTYRGKEYSSENDFKELYEQLPLIVTVE